MKKVLFALIGCFVAICAHAAQIVNVDYIHKLIQQEWDVTVPIRTDNVMAAANMKYLLTAIDVANQILNGEKTTDYGNGEFATLQAVDTIATNQAVETLIKKEIEYEFSVTIDIEKANNNCLIFGGEEEMTSEHGISLSAAGTFYIDWGDGTTETIKKTDTEPTYHLHDYGTKSGVFTIRIGGKATDYNDDDFMPSIGFSNGDSMCAIISHGISSIDGSLGAIFSTLPDGSQPRFSYLFKNCYHLTGTIPENLFAGISGAPASYMFDYTFYGCRGLTSIPAGLFAGISGAPASYMFNGTFENCSGLTSIPSDLFAGISGAPASFMLDNTFSNCGGLSGAIPAGLFAGISGAPAVHMFYRTFWGCSGLTSIPENLFGNISGPAQYYMFSRTFYDCTSLTGPSARINGQYVYEIWPDATEGQVGDMYENATGLDDYRCIPTVWGGGGKNCSAPAPEFTLTTTSSTRSFEFSISAAGEFVVDWGDGTVETITKPDTTNTIYSHNYDTANTYTIGLSGQATAYLSTSCNWSKCASTSISFSNNTNLHAVSGSLGEIFGILSDGTMANFSHSFYNCNNLIGISENLFKNGNGQITSDRFMSTFWGCRNLMAIPETLLGNDSSIFTRNSIDYVFEAMFTRCDALTGPSARINGQYVYEIWPDATEAQVGDMYENATGLSDYSTMPSAWK